ncbi:hypothetical protein ACHAWC_001561, partial [Mediolabrus comicus]
MNSNNGRSALWHGLGLFGESYLLFSIGTLRPLWQELYPTCFSTNINNDAADDDNDNNSSSSSCSNPYLTYNSLSYSVVLGVMLGMVIIGNLAGNIGRRKCSLLNASVMVGGSTLLVVSSCFLSGQFDNRYDYYSGQQQDIDDYDYAAGSSSNYSRPDVLFQVMSISLFIFGIGVGGEYPLSASLASERAMIRLNERRRREEEESSTQQQRGMRRNDTTTTTLEMMSSRLLLTATATTVVSSSYKNVVEKNDNNKNNSDNQQYYSWQTTTNNNHRAVVNNSSQWVENYNLNDEGEKDMQQHHQQQQQQQQQQDLLSKTRTRGKEVIFVFSMQGMGILANSLILTFLLLVTRQTNPQQQQQQQDDNNSSSHSQQTLLYIWRTIYIIGWFVLIYVLVSRICYLDESEVWAKDQLLKQQQQQQRDGGGSGDGSHSNNMEENQQQQQQQQNHRLSSERQLLYKHYGTRLFGTSITWLLWDIAFYGNKLFQSTFLIALTGENASLVQISGASAINAFVALLGYYAAALIVDNPAVGRLRLQQIGFVITGTLFLMCGILNDQLSSMTLVILYL